VTDEETRAAAYRAKLCARRRACVARNTALAGDPSALRALRANVQPLVDALRERDARQYAAGEDWPCE
jgi:hypothetical protein